MQASSAASPAGTQELTSLSTLNTLKVPCFIHRPQPGNPNFSAVWANDAACDMFGRPTTAEERENQLATAPPGHRELLIATMTGEYNEVMVAGKTHSWRLDAKASLNSVFTQIPASIILDLYAMPCTILIDGKVEVAILAQCLEATDGPTSRGLHPTSMYNQGRIHSYLFNTAGVLLHANEAATNDWKARGPHGAYHMGRQEQAIKLGQAKVYWGMPGTPLTYSENFHLKDLLLDNGTPQPDAATAGLTALFKDNKQVHRCTLPAVNSEGKVKWIMYEMWPAYDPVNNGSAMLINSLDMTQQKTLEIELEQAKRELLRRNQSLETRKTKLEADQIGLKRQQQALAEQLRQALELHMHPRTAVDTVTVADKAINLLDSFIQGKVPSLEEALAVRNAMVSAQDLRQPQNLDTQLLQESGLSKDVGLAMVELLQGDSHTSAKTIMARKAPPRSLLSVRSGLPGQLHPVDSARFAAIPASLQAMPEVIWRPLIPETEQLLQEASCSWSFDMFRLAAATGNQPLSALGFFLIKRAGLLEMFGIPEDTMLRFLRMIEEGYKWNKYHNRVHAACVLQMMHMLMHAGLMEDGVLEGITMLACYCSAIVHDFDHPGVNNDFLIKTRHILALTHNDASPLEAHHISSAIIKCNMEPDGNIGQCLSRQDESIMRATCIELVLATDMKKHFGLVSVFQAIHQPVMNAESRLPSLAEVPVERPASSSGEGGRLAHLSAQQKLLIAQVALKCADLSHLACTPEIHSRWVGKLTEEFFLQGDQEQARGMPISPLMDRSKMEGMSKSQVGFFEIVALPLFNSYVDLMPEAKPMLDNVCANYKQWHELHAQ